MAASLAGLEAALEPATRLAEELAIRRVLLLHALAFAHGGMPLIYMGDELGLRNDPHWADDPAHADDNRWMHRPPMDWEAAERRHDPGRSRAHLGGAAAARGGAARHAARSTPRAAASRCGRATTARLRACAASTPASGCCCSPTSRRPSRPCTPVVRDRGRATTAVRPGRVAARARVSWAVPFAGCRETRGGSPPSSTRSTRARSPTPTATGSATCGGIRAHLDHLAELGVDVLWLSPIYPSPQDDNGYDIADYQDIDPTFGTLEDFDALLADRPRPRHAADHGPRRQPHLRRAPVVRGVALLEGQPQARLVLVARAAATTGLGFSGSAWELDEATGEYYLHLFSRKQPDLNWENPEVRARRLRDDALVAGPRGRRVPHGRHQHDLQGPGAARRRRGEAASGVGGEHYISGPRIHEFLQEMHREVFAGRDALLTVGEMPGVTIEEARLFTDPARDELDMVFQFEHVQLDQGGSKWDARPLRPARLKAPRALAGRGSPTTGWNSLYWNNHDQPRAVSRLGDDGEHRVRSAKMLGTVLHLHRGTPYVYQGEELGMTNVAVRLDRRRSGTSSRSTPTPRRSRAATPRATRSRACGR